MRLRSVCFLLLATLIAASCSRDKRFTVIGDFKNLGQQHVLLEELRISDSINVIDSARADAGGKFELTGESAEPGLFRLKFEQGGYVLLTLQQGTVRVTGDYRLLPEYTVQGSAPSQSLQGFLRGVSGYMRDISTLDEVTRRLHTEGRDSAIGSAQADQQHVAERLTQYVERYADTTSSLPNALFSVRILNPMAEQTFIESFLQTLPRRFPKATQAAEFNDRWRKMIAMRGGAQPAEQPQAEGGPAAGVPAPPINLPTPQGNMVALSSLKGKYVLVDFWASWCGPCRAENPNVVAAFNKYKDKGFTVYGVSLDEDKARWMKAIEADGLTWTHVSDLKRWESVAARDYGVESIPTNFLLDKEGRIVARDLRGAALEARLAELMK